MRTRRKLTATGALAVAAAAIGGGAFVTSHAMADDAAPTKGTVTVVSMQAGDDEAISCTYDDIELPALPGPGEAGDVVAGSLHVVTASGSGEAPPTLVDGSVPPPPEGGPVLTPGAAGEQGTMTFSIAGEGGDGPIVHTEGTPPGAVLGGPDAPILVQSSSDARPGTAEECAALRPEVATP